MALQTNAADIHLRSSQAIGLLSTTPLSIVVWVNANWASAATVSMVGIYGPATDTPLGTPVTAVQLGTRTGTNELSCWTWGGGVLVATATNVMNAYNNVWVCLGYSYDGTTHSLYRNGVLMASTTTAQISGYLNQIYVNGYPTGGTNEVASFQVDQYELFRRALSANEMLTIFNAGGSRHGINNNVIAKYGFDELGQGITCSSVVDFSGNGMSLSSFGPGAAMTHTYTNVYANSNIRPVQ